MVRGSASLTLRKIDQRQPWVSNSWRTTAGKKDKHVSGFWPRGGVHCAQNVLLYAESDGRQVHTDGVGGLARRDAGRQGEGAGVQAAKSDQSFSSNPK